MVRAPLGELDPAHAFDDEIDIVLFDF